MKTHRACSLLLAVVLSPGCAATVLSSTATLIAALPSALIGQPRSAIETRYLSLKNLDDGTIAYTDSLSIRYKEGRAVELREKVPPNLGCKEAAHWMGFTTARVPILQKHRCLWPHDSPRHGLGPGILGTMELKSRIFTVHLPENSY